LALLLDALGSVDFLRGAAEAVVLRLMVLGKSTDHEKGHAFWRAGDAPSGLLIPVSGEVKSYSLNEDGRELIHRLAGTGETLGVASALDGLAHPTSVEALRAGEFFAIGRDSFLQFLREHPELYPVVVREVCRSYRQNVEERQQMALFPVPRRIARLLMDHACLRQADGARVLIEATQTEIAARVGTVREVVARTLSDFSQRGLLERDGPSLFVSDWAGLCAEAGLDADARHEVLSPRDGPVVRTARFFLSSQERRRARVSNDPSTCLEHLGDLELCRRKGCAAAALFD
jgi:CRP-like cAMP-binding protein